MTDQLGLGFEAPLPVPPALRPMLARTVAGPFDSPDHRFEPVWGGLRVLIRIEAADDGVGGVGAGTATLVDEAGRTLAVDLPELDGVAVRIAARSAVLEAELVATDARGRPDAVALEARLRGGSGSRVAVLVADLLDLDGRSLLAWPLDRRLATLKSVLRPGDELLAIPSIVGEGRALFDAVAAQGLAGVRARHRASPYLPGVRSRLWRFVPVEPGAAADGIGSGAPDDPGDPGDARSGASATPVLALIRRLPLGFDD